jgi:hypothetical protein
MVTKKQHPKWKVYTAAGKLAGAVHETECAAALAAYLGKGATVRFSRLKKDTVWIEGEENKVPSPAGVVPAELIRRHKEACKKVGRVMSQRAAELAGA